MTTTDTDTKKQPDIDAAAAFLAAHGRVLDRRVFQRLFGGGTAGAVRDAVAAYRGDDDRTRPGGCRPKDTPPP